MVYNNTMYYSENDRLISYNLKTEKSNYIPLRTSLVLTIIAMGILNFKCLETSLRKFYISAWRTGRRTWNMGALQKTGRDGSYSQSNKLPHHASTLFSAFSIVSRITSPVHHAVVFEKTFYIFLGVKWREYLQCKE